MASTFGTPNAPPASVLRRNSATSTVLVDRDVREATIRLRANRHMEDARRRLLELQRARQAFMFAENRR
jgi:hypothetical protein